MTSNNPSFRRRVGPGGFTLVEIVLVIAMGVVFFGGAALLLVNDPGDKDLADTRKLLQAVARGARLAALSQGKKQIVFLNVTGAGGQSFPVGVQMDLITPRDMAAGLKGWGRPQDYEWTFTAGGLVEPIRVRLRKGDVLEQFSFSALTGEILNETAEPE